jgi:predicted NBD/HSP70 family sugar kinase
MKSEPRTVAIVHGNPHLGVVMVDAYNSEVRDDEGEFIGDRATKGAFRDILEASRDRLREVGEDPLGEKPTAEFSKKKLDKILQEGEPEAAGVVHGAIEQFATELAKVAARLLKGRAWRPAERIAVGGGLRGSRIGELAIGRASVLLKGAGHDVPLKPIELDPDEAGLTGAVYLAPAWMLAGHDAILAVDIGGSNIRAGVVELKQKKGVDVVQGALSEFESWCHADEQTKPSRGAAVERLVEMLKRLVRRAEKADLTLAPFVGIGCPGVITEDGSIERGGQNLPGNWESTHFNVPAEIRKLLPTVGDADTVVVMHNDAVVQGLGELPFMRDVEHWGVLTIGTGLGNAVFTNVKESAKEKK